MISIENIKNFFRYNLLTAENVVISRVLACKENVLILKQSNEIQNEGVFWDNKYQHSQSVSAKI